MSIRALPESTVRLMGSAMNIITPCDLVKELIDNAIDAKAKAIEITISSNTVDRIVVKDNGRGIDIDDFDLLGRRAHTSKLRTFEELTTLGGKTMGFRGEALASANTLADIVIITKKSGDPIAWRMELNRGDGGIKNKRPVSATVGTTVAATNLFENMPPRKQSLLKENKQTMSKIQDMAKAYVLARPYIKLSLKIVGDAKPTWAYSPGGTASEHEAILQLFGANLLKNCTRIDETMSEPNAPNGPYSPDTMEWAIRGYVGLQHSKINKTQAVFVSIDGRPMSSSWNVSKKMVKSLKTYAFREVGNKPQSRGRLFMQLNIQCPVQSYDPNTTAQKDEVLLADEKFFLDGFEMICQEVFTSHLRCHTPVPCTSGSDSNKDVAAGDNKTSEDQSLGKNEGLNDSNSLQPEDKTFGYCSPNLLGHDGLPDSGKSPTNQSTIKTTLRTFFNVNLSKKEEDSSDFEDHPNAIEVEIPRRTVKVQQHGHLRKENIRQYFQPVTGSDFEIASDDTATRADTVHHEQKEQNFDSPIAGRFPLKPLTSSDLNKIRDEAESRPVQSGPSFAVPHTDRPRRYENAAVDVSSIQSHNDPTHPIQVHEGLQTSFQPSPTQSQTIRQHQGAMRSEPLVRHLPLILTPPPSDPRYREGPDSPPSRPHLRLLDVSPTRANKMDQANHRSTALANTPSSDGQIRESSRRGIESQRPLPVSRLHGEGSRRLFGEKRRRVANVAGILRRKEARTNKNPVGTPTGIVTTHPESSCSLASLQRPTLAASKQITHEPLEVPLGYSHALQIELARTPGPILAMDANQRRFLASTTGERNLGGVGDENRLLDVVPFPEMVKATQSGHPLADMNRRSSTGQCVSSIPGIFDGNALFCSTSTTNTNHLGTTVHCGIGVIERLVAQYANLDKYELPGNIAIVLLSASLSDVQTVQRRLQISVNTWMQQNDIRGQVDYIM